MRNENRSVWVTLVVLLAAAGTLSELRDGSAFGQNRTRATSAVTPTVLARGLKRPWDCSVDATDVYWREGSDRIMRVNKNGGDPVTIVAGEKILAYAVDATNIYYLTDTELKKIGKDGASPLALVKNLRNFFAGAEVALDETNVYWLGGNENPIPPVRRGPHDSDDKLMKVAKSGGEPALLASHVHYAWNMLVDAKYVYWSESDHILKRVAKNGGQPEVLAQESHSSPGKIAADQTSIYWVDSVGPIIKVDKNTGQASKTLRQPHGSIHHLIVDDGTLYWVDNDSGSIMKLGKDGGKSVSLIDNQDPTSIAVDEKYVYWTDVTGLVLKTAK